jgi:folylpolyglutamate synthase
MASHRGRTYEDAIALLNSLQSNRAITSSISNAPRDMNFNAIPEMLEWTRKAGYNRRDFAGRGLRCVHVAGTKGKGSTCVMVENLLLQYRKEDTGTNSSRGEVGLGTKGLGKIGLYTSPHLITVRERIRIDGDPISESLFTRYFFELWDRFSHTAAKASHPDPESPETKPGYFRYLTLIAFHTFMEEGVQTAIVECGIGGEYDSTNILPPEAVTVSAITRLGIDHVGMLGGTIGEIAWHKAGIMKEGVPLFTVVQEDIAQDVLEKRAAEKGVELSVVNTLPVLVNGEVKMGLDGEFQKDNASLAVAVAASHLRTLGVMEDVPSPTELIKAKEQLPQKFVKGLETTTWQGRWQVLKQGNIEYHIDGAHTTDSIHATTFWFRSKVFEALDETNPPTATMLIFNQQSDRDAKDLLRTLITSLGQSYQDNPARQHLGGLYNSVGSERPKHKINMATSPPTKLFTYAAFCRNDLWKVQEEEGERDIGLQKDLAKMYQTLDGNVLNMAYGSIGEAVDLARRVSADEGERLLVLVTGSLYLVGGLLEVLAAPVKPIPQENEEEEEEAV